MALTTATIPTDGVVLRAMTEADLPAAHALTAELRWPHRPTDWAQAFAHAEGLVAERDGQVVGTALRWRWGPKHATIGLVVVSPACQGRRIGHRLMTGLLDGLDGCSVLLHATSEGRGCMSGWASCAPARSASTRAWPCRRRWWRRAPAAGCARATEADLPALRALDAAARAMPRHALVDALFSEAEATVVLDEDGEARGFAMLRRFGRGHAIGPVVAPEAEGAQVLIAHLAGLNTGRFTRIDIDFDTGLAEWLESLGLLRVDAPTTMCGGRAAGAGAPGAAACHRHPGAGLMRPVFLYKGGSGPRPQWAEVFQHEAPDIDFRCGPTSAMRRRCATWPRGSRRPTWPPASRSWNWLLSTGAGVDQLDLAALPPQLPVVRMVEPGIVQGMVEYVTHAVLDLHRDMPAYRRAQQQRLVQALRVLRRPSGAWACWGWARWGRLCWHSWPHWALIWRAGAAHAMPCLASSAMPAAPSWAPSWRAPRSWSACCR